MNNNIAKTEKFDIKKFLYVIQEKISTSPYSYLALCFAVPALIMYLIYIALGIHPFGNGTVLILDLNAQYIYFFEALRNLVYGEGSMLYSFFRSLGGEFMGMYAYYLASPLSYIVALFPQENMLEAMLTLILLKVGLCGFSFGFYLHKHTKNPNKAITIAFSVLYSLSAYAVVYQSNVMWLDALIWLPVIAYGIEQLIKNGRYKLFVIALAMSIMSNYYIGYMTCFFVVIYYFYYYFANSKEEINPHKQKLHFLRSFARITCFSLLAVAISAFIILGAYYSLSFGKSTFTEPNWIFKEKFDILDFLTKFLPGAYDTVRPAGLPFVYCGIITVILVPVYFASRKISAREKIFSLIFILIFILSFIASPLDLIWHGFQAPNWLNYRYSFMLCFFLLVIAYKGFGNLKEVGTKFIIGATALIIIFVAICDKLDFPSYVENEGELSTLQTVWLTIIAVLAVAIVLCLIIRQNNFKKRGTFSCILSIVICIEIFCSSISCLATYALDVGGYGGGYTALINNSTGYKNYTEFLGNLRPIVNDLKEMDTGFYRMEKLVHRKVNDNMALGIRGISNSTSTLHADSIAFLKTLGYSARSHRSIYYGGTPVNDSLLGIKYVIDKKDSNKLDYYYDVAATNGMYSAYLNPYALSIAYGVDSSINEYSASEYITHFDRLNNLVSAMAGSSDEMEIFKPIKDYDVDTLDSTEGGNLRYVTYTPNSSRKGEAFIVYSFVATESAEYYFHSPSKTSNETYLYVNATIEYDDDNGYQIERIIDDNGNEIENATKIGYYLGSDTNNIMSLGYYEKGDVVNVTIKLLNNNYITVDNFSKHIWYIDEPVFEEAFTKLKENPQFEITEYTEDNLIGNITTKEEKQTILTTIPYDEGWKVYVDGKEVETYEALDALIAFDIENAGEHSLELKYSPDIYKTGAVISIIGIVIFIGLCIADIILYFTVIKKKKLELYSIKDTPWTLDDMDSNDNTLTKDALVIEEKGTTVQAEIDSTITETENRDDYNQEASNAEISDNECTEISVEESDEDEKEIDETDEKGEQ